MLVPNSLNKKYGSIEKIITLGRKQFLFETESGHNFMYIQCGSIEEFWLNVNIHKKNLFAYNRQLFLIIFHIPLSISGFWETIQKIFHSIVLTFLSSLVLSGKSEQLLSYIIYYKEIFLSLISPN